MNKKPNPYHPRLVKIEDKHGDDMTPMLALRELRATRKARDADCFALPKTVQEDLQAVRRRPLDAPMATRLDDVVEPIGVGRAVLTLLLMAASFIAGLAVGRAV